MVLVVIVAVTAGAVSGDVAARDSQPVDARDIAPGLYPHQVASRTPMRPASATLRMGFILRDQAVAVREAGRSVGIGQRLSKAVKAVNDTPMRDVTNGHEHPVRVFRDAAFVAPGVIFVAHKNLRRALAERGPHYFAALRRTMGDALLKDLRLIAPSLLVDHEMRLNLDHRILVLLHDHPCIRTAIPASLTKPPVRFSPAISFSCSMCR